MKIVGKVESLWRYPVKSMMGESLTMAYLGAGGVFGDRRYGFLSSAAPADFPYFTARERHEMLLHCASYRHPEKMTKPNGGTTLADAAIDVETPSGERIAVDDPRLIESLLAGLREGRSEQRQVTLIHSENAIVDSRPMSLCSLQTVRQLCEEIGAELDKRRFRANIYVDLTTGGGFAEDAWVGWKLRLGERAVIEIHKRNKRCKLITLDPNTGEANPEVMKRVARDHEGQAGVYGSVLVEGTVMPGDEIRLVE